ncbi:hypothetical protein [Deinococcus sp.]|uniref:hypothetical protein n=1 Tax=Deinococcus sp. TaxID=47478 RepID=UPI003B597938
MQWLTLLRWVVRASGVLALALGLIFWSGGGYALLGLHQTLGYIVSLALLIMALIAFPLRVSPVLLIVAILWSFVVPGVGSAQLRLLPGDQHWSIQVFHLLLGVGAIGLAEVIAGRAGRLGARS